MFSGDADEDDDDRGLRNSLTILYWAETPAQGGSATRQALYRVLPCLIRHGCSAFGPAAASRLRPPARNEIP